MKFIANVLTVFAASLMFAAVEAAPGGGCKGEVWHEPADCHIFYKCGASGEVITQWCGPGTAFDPKDKTCKDQAKVCPPK